ncbi:MAG TPA: sigma 54-interacting transcriptional regulator [Clostridia bacterium]|nr:sigma 54-interacting transcriptional regulator [Clostridia bacterium]
MKKVAIITFWAKIAQMHSILLKKLFGDRIEVSTYSFDVDSINSVIDADLFVFSLYSIYVTVKKYIPARSQVVIINTTINAQQYEQIMEIPAGQKVMVVNYSSEMTMETIALFNQLGISHIEFYPFYPGITNIPELGVAITPGEAQYVPHCVKKVVDIDNRIMDTATIIDIAGKLNMDSLLQEEHFIDYFNTLKTYRSGLQALLGRTNTLESEMESLLNVLDDGIIGIDAVGLIYAFNKRAESITGCWKDTVIGKSISDVLPEIPFSRVIKSAEPVKAMLIRLNDKDISTTIVPVIVLRKVTGAFAIINEFTEQERNQHKLRLQLLGKGHKAKYRFEDIYGKSEAMLKLKNTAERMAKSDSSVLISGESGTGKELFAQAIHNASRRKDYQFVAVNCAALPENLLESELFGYEEGAFTGARKGGKIGLFELAHKGTLFLDEIGEMALNIQARLLRVIQEREVMRIGGDRVIKIDIRILAATNKNLKKLVEEGRFRKDLYYRLNVLPLGTIPLRNRQEEILPLAELIKKELGAKFELSQEAARAFACYKWEGNVRELKNCIEYLAHLGKKVIELQDITFARHSGEEEFKLCMEEAELAEKLIKTAKYGKEKYLFVLECLEKSRKNRSRIGRRSLVELAYERDLFVSENEVRGILNILNDYGMVNLSNGRGGTQITELGTKIYRYMKAGLNE